MRRAEVWIWAAVVLVVLLEVGAFLGEAGGDPLSLGEGWGPTRPLGPGAWVLLLGCCLPLLWLGRRPGLAGLLCTAAYAGSMLTGHPFGLTLPPMLAILVLAARGRRLLAWVSAVLCLAATLVWIHGRAAGIHDPEVGMLVWVAFGAVSALFFVIPALVGELVSARRALSPSGAP